MKTRSIFRFVVLNVVLALSAIAAVGQACPTVRVVGPSDDPVEGATIYFTADVRGEGEDNVTFNWTLSAGIIMSGQGQSAITVDTTDTGGSSITATVEIGGLPPDCPRSASSTAGIRPKLKPRKFDEYGAIKLADEHARLDNYTIELQNDPMSQGYIITYGGKTSTPTAAKTASTKAWKWLVEKRGLDASRIVQIDGGYREEPFTELWIVPRDALPPTASPTVDPSEVKPPKKATKKKTTKKR